METRPTSGVTVERDLRDVVPAVALAAVAFLTYLIGSDRTLGYDAAVTMEFFVSGPPSWAFTRQVVWNNHPVFSFAASLVADVAGTSERAMRILPAFAGASASGLFAWRVGVHWGRMAGLAGGIVMATHPLLAELSRDVRGYSLATLASVVMGVAVLDRRSPALFGVAAVVAGGTHLYALIPLAVLVAYLVAAGRFSRPWRVAALASLTGVVAVYAGTAAMSGRSGGRVFRPTYPAEAAWTLLGENWLAATPYAVLVVLAVAWGRWSRSLVAAVGVAALGVIGPWIVAPQDLYGRFVYWALPGLALGAAWVVRRRRSAVVLVLLGAAAASWPMVDTWSDDSLPNRAIGEHMGPGSCLAPLWSSEAVLWYAPPRPDVCTSVGILERRGLEAEVASILEEWTVVCWRGSGGLVVARDRADCPR